MQAMNEGTIKKNTSILIGTNNNEGTCTQQQLYGGRNQPQLTHLVSSLAHTGTTFVYAGVHFSLPTFLYQLAMDFVFDDKAKDVLAFYKVCHHHHHDTASHLRGHASLAQCPLPLQNITGGEFDDSRKVLSRVLTDYWFRCASERLATGAVEFGAAQAFVYRYDHIFSDSALFTKFGLPAACENAVNKRSQQIKRTPHNTGAMLFDP